MLLLDIWAQRLVDVLFYREQEVNSTHQPDQPKAEPQPSTSGPKAGEKTFSMEEVAKHNKKDDIWVTVNGQVLDVTNVRPNETHTYAVKQLTVFTVPT